MTRMAELALRMESADDPGLTFSKSGDAWRGGNRGCNVLLVPWISAAVAITYARRYAWQSVLGIAAEEDTDATEEVQF